jgi:hypothetical protein
MKYISLSILLTLLLLAPAFAQRVSVADASKYGNFTATTTTGNTQEVRYILEGAYPSNIVLQVIPRADFKLNAHIVDAKGTEVQGIEPAMVSGRYVNSIDVSKLGSGNYFIEMQNNAGDGNTYRIPFSIGTN